MSKLSPDQWQALSPHLDQALEMTDDERVSWLSSLHGENPTLAYQLEILLREHRLLSQEGFLEASALELPGGPGWPVRSLECTHWFRKLAMGEWAQSGWRNETTGDLNGVSQ